MDEEIVSVKADLASKLEEIATKVCFVVYMNVCLYFHGSIDASVVSLAFGFPS